MIKRILLVFIGNLIIGVSIGLSVYCNFGIDPSTTFFTGINNIFNIGLGNCIAIGNLFLFIPMYLIDKKTINLGTFVNMFGIGYVVEYSSAMWINILPEFDFLIKLLLLFISLLVICFGIGLYLSANMGQAPWDALGHLFTKMFPKVNYASARMVQDVLAITVGFLLKSPVGFGSLIFAFGLGPGINFFKKLLAKAI